MKQARLLSMFIGLFFLSSSVWNNLPGQSCLQHGVFLSTQYDIDFFSSHYGGCKDILGSLIIHEYTPGSITNLDGLSQIESVGGTLCINTTKDLTSLSGLDNITTVGGDVEVYYNKRLASLDGLGNLNSVGGHFDVYSNDLLGNVEALSSLTSIGGGLRLYNNPALVNLDGLEGVGSLGGYLYIVKNASLNDIEGLMGLEGINGQLHVLDNPNLNSLSGLDNIDYTTISFLFIFSNDLSVCGVTSICDYLNFSSNSNTVGANAYGCNSSSQITSSCPDPSSTPSTSTTSSLFSVSWASPLEAELQGQNSLVKWSVAQQINNDFFVVEYSVDGMTFLPIGKVEGDGNLADIKTFTFIHKTPEFGTNYYRIKSVDYDGKEGFSNIASIKYITSEFQIYPNPVISKINITSSSKTEISIFNHVGVQFGQHTIIEGQNEIYLNHLPSGLYIIRTESGEITKIIKQ